jgi:hypothetical protein
MWGVLYLRIFYLPLIMSTVKRYNILLTILFIIFFSKSKAQYILAGNYDCTNYHLTYSPPFNVPGYISYDLDLNGDSIFDFTLYHLSSIGGASVDQSCYIEPKGQNEIAFGYVDTLVSSCGSTGLRDIPKIFSLNDTINSNLVWKNNRMYFNELQIYFGCSTNSINANPNNLPIGLKIITAGVSLYAWVCFPIATGSYLHISGMACEANLPIIQPFINQSGNTLTSNYTNGNQWFINDTAIVGATSQSYTITKNGYYSLVISNTGCNLDTASINIVDLSTKEYDSNSSAIYIAPNPFPDNIHVTLSSKLQRAKWQLYNQIGEIELSGTFESKDNVIEMDDLPCGMYFLKTEFSTSKIIKINQ